MPATLRRLGCGLTALLLLAFTGHGCTASSPTQGGFSSNAPAARTWALSEAVRSAQETGSMPRRDLESIVELLSADDAMIRFMAISGLESISNTNRGYRFFDPAETRHEAVVRWRDFARETRQVGSITVADAPS